MAHTIWKAFELPVVKRTFDNHLHALGQGKTWIRLVGDSSYYISAVSLEIKLPTIWTDEKQRWEESEKRRREEMR